MHNGYTNYLTWSFGVVLDNTETLYKSIMKLKAIHYKKPYTEKLDILVAYFRKLIDDNMFFYKNNIGEGIHAALMNEINFEELAKGYIDEE